MAGLKWFIVTIEKDGAAKRYEIQAASEESARRGFAGQTVVKVSPAIHLQGIGRCEAKPAGSLNPGDKIVYNFGYVYEVVSVEHWIKKVKYVVRNHKGETFNVEKRATTMVAVKGA